MLSKEGDLNLHTAPTRHLSYLDTMRGLAAIQVLLLHSFTAYFPNFVSAMPASGTIGGYIHASPFFFLYDGSSAVFVFFVLSGYVLTPVARKSRIDLSRITFSRLVRLGVPAIACCTLSAVIYQILGGYNDAAAALFISGSLSQGWHPPSSLWFFKDAVMNGIILGYKDYGIIGWLGYPTTALDSLSTSFAAPLWTLTNEFYGSILIFVLARYLLPHSRMSWVILAIVVVLLSRTALLCLVVGHIAARFRLGERAPTLPFPASLALILISTATCIASQFWIPIPFVNFCSLSNQILLPCFFAPAFTMRMYGAIGLTLGVMQCQPLQTRLAHRRFRTLGRLSFPLYLVHWPVIFGVASFVLVVFEPIIGVFAARCVAFLSGVVISAAGAYCFIPIDQMALRISRACRT